MQRNKIRKEEKQQGREREKDRQKKEMKYC
jgi:hypothetical protein